MRTSKKGNSIRRGFDYQDHVGALKLLEMLDLPGQPHVQLESEDGIHVDDVLVYTGECMEYYQVKFATSPSATLSFDDLLEHPEGKKTRKSLWQKFADTWRSLREDQPNARMELHLYSNRAPANDGDLASVVDPETGRINQEALEQPRLMDVRQRLIEESGLSEADFGGCLSDLRFDLNQFAEHEMVSQVRLRLRAARAGEDRYESLMRQCLAWATMGREPLTKLDVRKALGLWWEQYDPLDQNFPIDRERVVPNRELIHQVDRIVDGLASGYVLVTGRPGSGKSTFLTTYAEHSRDELKQPTIVYYCFTDPADPRLDERARAHSFIQSVAERLNIMSGRDEADGPYRRDVESLMTSMSEVARRLATEKRKLVVILDGLDHVLRLDREGGGTVVDVLPRSLPDNVIFIVGTQPRDDLPRMLRSPVLPSDQKVEVRGFSPDQVIDYMRRSKLELKHIQSLTELGGDDFIRALIERSDGLPIYVRYIVERYLQERPEEPLRWLRALPVVSEGISRYYASLWPDLSALHRRVLVCLACSRFPVSADELERIIDEPATISRYQIRDALQEARHLLLEVGDGRWRVCHDSFSEFAREIEPDEIKRSLDNIYSYLKDNANPALAHGHLMHYASAVEDWKGALARCDLAYIDEKMVRGRPGWETDNDILLAIDAAARLRDAQEILRCGLLRFTHHSRTEYQLDVTLYCTTLVHMDRASDAMHYMVNRDWLTVSSKTALEAGIELARRGQLADATDLLRTVDSALDVGERAWNDLDLDLWLRLHAVCTRNVAATIARIDGINRQSDTDANRRRLRSGLLGWLSANGEAEVLLAAVGGNQSTSADSELIAAASEALARKGRSEEALRLACSVSDGGLDPVDRGWVWALSGADPDELARLLSDIQIPPPLDYGDYPEELRVIRRSQRFLKYVALLSYCGQDREVAALRDVCGGDVSPIGSALTALTSLWGEVGRSLRATDLSHLDALGQCFTRLRTDEAQWRGRNHDWMVESTGRALLDNLLPLATSELLGPVPEAAQQVVAFAEEAIDAILVTSAALFSVLDRSLPMMESDDARPHIQNYVDRFVLSEPVMGTRANLWLQMAGIASRCGLEEMGDDFLRQAIETAAGYGYHKDFRLLELVDGLAELSDVVDTRLLGRLSTCAEMLRWMGRMTDHDEVDYIGEKLVDLTFSLSAEAGCRLYWEMLEDPEFDRMFHADNALLAISRQVSESSPEAAIGLWRLLTSTDPENLDKRTGALLEVVDEAFTHGMDIVEWAREWVRLELAGTQQQEALAALDESHNGRGTAYWDAYRRSSSSGGSLERERSVLVDGEEIDANGLRDIVAAGLHEAEEVLSKLPSSLPLGFDEAIADGVGDLTERVSGETEVLRLMRLTDQRVSSIYQARTWKRIGEVARRIGLVDSFIECMKRAHQRGRSWYRGWGGAGLDAFRAFADVDVEEARDFLYEDLSAELKEHWWTASSALLPMMRALGAVGLGGQVLPLVDVFEEHCRSLFRKVNLDPNRFEWMTHIQDRDQINAEETAVAMVVDHFSHPEVDVNRSAVQAVADLWQERQELVTRSLSSALCSEDYHLKSKATMTCHAVSLRRPDLVADLVHDLQVLIGDDAVDVADSARQAISALAEANCGRLDAPGPADTEALWEAVGSRPRLYVPSRSIPVQTRQLLTPLIREFTAVAQVLNQDPTEFLGEVYRRMLGLGYNEEAAVESRERAMWRYTHPNAKAIIPFEDGALSIGRQAMCEIVPDIAKEQRFSAADVAFVLSHLRRYDPELLLETPTPRPSDISFPGESLSDEEWLAFADHTEDFSQQEMDDDIEICGSIRLSLPNRDHTRRCSRSNWAVLCPSAVTESIGIQWVNGRRKTFALMVPSSEEEATLPLSEMRDRISRSRAVPDREGVLPLIQMGLVHWWYGEPRELLFLAGWAIAEAGLTWERQSLRLYRDDEAICIPEWWAEGRSTAFLDRSRLNHGQRLMCSARLLSELSAPRSAHIVWLHTEKRELTDGIREETIATETKRSASVWQP